MYINNINIFNLIYNNNKYILQQDIYIYINTQYLFRFFI